MIGHLGLDVVQRCSKAVLGIHAVVVQLIEFEHPPLHVAGDSRTGRRRPDADVVDWNARSEPVGSVVVESGDKLADLSNDFPHLHDVFP